MYNCDAVFRLSHRENSNTNGKTSETLPFGGQYLFRKLTAKCLRPKLFRYLPFLFPIQLEASSRMLLTDHTVMLESAEPVTILSSLQLVWRPHTLSWWASSVITHSLVLMVHSFTKPSEPLWKTIINYCVETRHSMKNWHSYHNVIFWVSTVFQGFEALK